MSKYDKHIWVRDTEDQSTRYEGVIDVYDVLEAFNVSCPAVQHAVKKLLDAGNRGYKGRKQDLQEARESLSRAIQLEEVR